MRIMAAILVIVQLLCRSAAVPHCHERIADSEPAGHANRPHIHVTGHSHSHRAHHGHVKHTHRHSGKHRISDTPVKPVLPPLSPFSSEHDDDALYVSSEALIVFSDRIQIPEPNDCEWLISNVGAIQITAPLKLVECRAAGPPREIAATHFQFLPHLLRV